MRSPVLFWYRFIEGELSIFWKIIIYQIHSENPYPELRLFIICGAALGGKGEARVAGGKRLWQALFGGGGHGEIQGDHRPEIASAFTRGAADGSDDWRGGSQPHVGSWTPEIRPH